MERRIKWWIFSLLLAVLAVFLMLTALVLGAKVLPADHASILLTLEDKKGGLQIFLQQLREQGGSISHSTLFEKSLNYLMLGKKINPGIYRITTKDSVGRLWKRLYQGAVDYQAITLVEGWTFKQMLASVASNRHLKHLLPSEHGKEGIIMEQIGRPAEFPEGRFAPDTYYFMPNSTDVALLKSAYLRLSNWLEQEWQQKETDRYQCPYQALIVASLLEREVRKPEELELVAGVILTRLAKGMRLQIDASTIYGLGDDFDGKLTRKHLQTSDTAYNTYRHYGLPPTPICMPSRRAIHAALHPKFGFLYYVAKGDGSHHFSKDLEEHNRAIMLYRTGAQKRN